MAKRGGFRPGAGRPKGAKTKRPFGNLPSAAPELPAATAEIIQAISVSVERKDWKRENRELVNRNAEERLQELEKRALEDGDNRLAFELLRFRVAYAQGLPVPGTNDGGVSVSDVIQKAWQGVSGAPPLTPSPLAALPEATPARPVEPLPRAATAPPAAPETRPFVLFNPDATHHKY